VPNVIPSLVARSGKYSLWSILTIVSFMAHFLANGGGAIGQGLIADAKFLKMFYDRDVA
jgi:hypothetical protein